jgi:ceramide glucosyltransferase
MTGVFALVAALLAVAGIAQAIAGAWLTRRFAARPRVAPRERPAITVLKPLHGDEPRLEDALASTCAQDYPAFQVVFGVQRADDPALAVVARLRQRFPDRDIAVVVDSRRHGSNPKIGNLINMRPAAKHDVLVIADSDLHVAPDWLDRVAAALEGPGTGLVCTLYAGLPATGALAERLGATQITHTFLPGALLARALGRQDCLGATMALRRQTLAAIGGLAALADHLADDNVLGRLVRAQGLAVALADTVPATTVPEATLGALWRHELRWARTIRALAPGPFAASVLQYPTVWALLAVALTGASAWSWGLFETAWVARALCARAVDRALGSSSRAATSPWPGRQEGGPGHESAKPVAGLAFRPPLWLLPVRELLSVGVMLASYAGVRVDWRGQTLHADSGMIEQGTGTTPKE